MVIVQVANNFFNQKKSCQQDTNAFSISTSFKK